MSKNNSNDIKISRVIVMMFMCFLLSVLTVLYIMPFRKQLLQISDYYKIIEYITMSVTFVLAVISIIYSSYIKKNNIDISNRVITPSMLVLLSIFTFASAVIIPLSNNRTIIYKYAILAFIILFISYFTYYFVDKYYVYQAVVCGVYVTVLLLLDTFYSGSITFNDKLALNYKSALIFSLIFVLAVIVITYIVNKKCVKINLIQTLILSAVIICALIVRFFIFSYVSLISVIVEIAFFLIMMYEYFKKK